MFNRAMNEKLGMVENQTHKHRIIVEPYIVPPSFANVAICWACGKERHVNTCGFCEECWVSFYHGRNAPWEVKNG